MLEKIAHKLSKKLGRETKHMIFRQRPAVLFDRELKKLLEAVSL
jgi:hypothetical protein